MSIDALAREVSFPPWLVQIWVRELGFSSAVPLMLALNESAPVTLRTNTLKTTREALLRALMKEDLPAREGKHSPWAIHLSTRKNLQATQMFRKGWFEVQDEASQLAVQATQATAGEFVIDVCTGAGGKALGLAAMMEKEGEIVAVDADSRNFKELEKRARRAGAKIIRSQWAAADEPNPLTSRSGQADAILIDAPCSSLGTLRRRPWMKWALTESTMSRFPATQLALLKRYAPLLKPGGRLVYATCTLHAEENEGVVGTFLREVDGFAMTDRSRQLRPDVEGTDAFFIAKLKRS
jgi:16S rRNA (cytosine967-C5)-methyltransferase